MVQIVFSPRRKEDVFCNIVWTRIRRIYWIVRISAPPSQRVGGIILRIQIILSKALIPIQTVFHSSFSIFHFIDLGIPFYLCHLCSYLCSHAKQLRTHINSSDYVIIIHFTLYILHYIILYYQSRITTILEVFLCLNISSTHQREINSPARAGIRKRLQFSSKFQFYSLLLHR